MGEYMIAEAMKAVFGEEPNDDNKKVGYRIALTRFEGMLKQAEAVLQGACENDDILKSSLRRAFGAQVFSGLEHFHADAQQIVVDIAHRFENRYAALAPDA